MGGSLTKENQRRRLNSFDCNSELHLATLRMIFKNETAQKAFLIFLNERKIFYSKILKLNFFKELLYFDIFQLISLNKEEKFNYSLLPIFGCHSNDFLNKKDLQLNRKQLQSDENNDENDENNEKDDTFD